MSLRIEMDRCGPPEVLRPVERPDPAPRPGEVAVRVAVAGVNRADCFIRSGQWPQGGGWPYTPGLEACGVVEEIGSGVTGVAPGDPVITMMQKLGGIHGVRPGGYQARLLCPADTLAPVPAGLDLETAGALGLPGVTAWLALATLEPRTGQRVLVTGATSAAGVMAIQLLAAAGCRVIASGRSAGKLERLRALGAAELVATGDDPRWHDRLEPVDGVFDLIGRATFAAAVDKLAPQGRLVFVGATSGGELELSGWALMRPVVLTGYSSETLDRAQLAEAMQHIAAAAAAGTLRVPALDRVPLVEAARAHRMLEAGENAGRMLLVPGE